MSRHTPFRWPTYYTYCVSLEHVKIPSLYLYVIGWTTDYQQPHYAPSGSKQHGTSQ